MSEDGFLEKDAPVSMGPLETEKAMHTERFWEPPAKTRGHMRAGGHCLPASGFEWTAHRPMRGGSSKFLQRYDRSLGVFPGFLLPDIVCVGKVFS
jgi:hypothetical protein